MNLIFQWMVTGLAALFASVLITALGCAFGQPIYRNFYRLERRTKDESA